MRYGIVYSIIDRINDKRYVGSTVNHQSRINEHFNSLRKNQHHSSSLQKAYNAYGIDNLIVDVLEEKIPYSIIRDREQYWIDKLNPEYNTYRDARKFKPFKFDNKTKDRIAKSHQKVKYNVYCLNNNKLYSSCAEAGRDLNINPYRINTVISGGAYQYKGYVFFKNDNNGWADVNSYLQFIKTRADKLRKDNSRTKPVIMISKDTGGILNTFDSINDASVFLSGSRKRANSISAACKGKYKSALGYKWKYIIE